MEGRDAEILFSVGCEVGRRIGIREVVDFIRATGYSRRIFPGNGDGCEHYFEVLFPCEKWLSQLQEWKMEPPATC